MGFYHLSIKMLKKNFINYRLFFSCNCVSTAIFFCFASMLFHEQFMDGYTVDSMISGNIIFPGVLMAGFMIVFLPLSYHVFWNARKQDYGVFLSLGMSRKEAVGNMIAESLTVSVFALLAAFMAGTFCSALFYGVLRYLLHIQGWNWKIPMESYVVTCLLHGVITVITIAAYSIKFLCLKIGRMLKNHDKSEGKGMVYRLLEERMPEYLNRNLIKFSFLMRHKKEWAFRYVLAGILVMAVTVLISLSACLFSGFGKDAEKYAPFDMTYVSLYGGNQMSLEEAEVILNQENVSVTSSSQIEFFRDNAFNYISVSELNRKFQSDYRIEEGTFLNLFQYDMNDGYEYDVTPVNNLTIKYDDATEELASSGSDIKIFWNRNPAFADRTLVLNDADFKLLVDNKNYQYGVINLFRFQDWKRSKDGITAVSEELRHRNGLAEPDQRILAVTSKIADFERAGQSGSVLALSMGFVIMMLYAACFILIHFRIVSEKEENSRSMKSLSFMGSQKSELKDILLFKNRVHFLVPVITGSMISSVPGYFLNQTYCLGLQGAVLCAFCGIVTGMIVWKSLKRYSRKEFYVLIDYWDTL